MSIDQSRVSLPIDWRARRNPLVACALVALGEVQSALVRRLHLQPQYHWRAIVFPQLVLLEGQHADLPWNQSEAHSAVYDTKMTADLFCKVINQWESVHGAPA